VCLVLITAGRLRLRGMNLSIYILLICIVEFDGWCHVK
jgi:hypothetical protein